MVLRKSIANSLTEGGHAMEDFAGSQKPEDRLGHLRSRQWACTPRPKVGGSESGTGYPKRYPTPLLGLVAGDGHAAMHARTGGPVRDAEIGVCARCVEGVLEGLAGVEQSGVYRPVIPGHGVRDRVGVRPGDRRIDR